jgi:Cu(I)/Ag(I) efflux system membrane fusion protein
MKTYSCPMKCEGDKTYDKEGKCPVCKMNLKEKAAASVAKAYSCPMKCEGDKTYDKEGKCPKCGMDLKEKKEDHANHQH